MKLIACITVILSAFILQISARPQRPFDYFLFTREWPGTFCSNEECKYHPKNTTVFTIHGLWPQYENGRWPQFCDPRNKFDPEQVEDLISKMNKYWPSYILGPFWKHEWEKHGTCCQNVFKSQHDYFAAGLALHEKYDLEDALAAADITPSSTIKYRLRDIHSAFRAALGAVPQVECEKGELNEVRMCVTKDLAPFDCPVQSVSCPPSVLLPPFPQDDDNGSESMQHHQPSASHTPIKRSWTESQHIKVQSSVEPTGLMAGTVGGSPRPVAMGVATAIMLVALLVILAGTVTAAAYMRPAVQIEGQWNGPSTRYVALVGEVNGASA